MAQLCLKSGASTVDVTPERAMFLHGYPHVARTSTGTHDPLLASALLIERGNESFLFISVDVLFVSKALTAEARKAIALATGMDPALILIAATHTHSGPVTVNYLSNEADTAVPPADPSYLRQLQDKIVRAGIEASRTRRPAEIAIVHANATGIGTCRHDPDGPSDLGVPVLIARDATSGTAIGAMMICAMHPTVLHEDSTLYSGDFPAMARQYLQARSLDCPIIYLTGASGDQSPRHVTRANTFEEARRLGEILGKAVESVLEGAAYSSDLALRTARAFVDLPRRAAPTVEIAERNLQDAHTRLNALRGPHASRADIRSAECDWFGAEETLAIARAAEQGRLDAALESCLPAEIQVFRIGPHAFVGWPGEFFVQFALDVKGAFPEASIATLANGDLQGYVVTQQAIDHNWYEAGNALLQSPDAGRIVVEKTIELLSSPKNAPVPLPKVAHV